MATQTGIKFEDFKADGTVRRVSFTWDDQTLFLTAVMLFDNTVDIPLPVKATVIKNGRTFQRTEAPGGPTEVEFVQPVPTNAASRLELFVNPDNGRLDGIDWQIG